MKKQKDLEEILERIDGKGYAAYRDIKGEYECKDYSLCIDHAQVDPFAPASKVRVRVKEAMHQIPKDLWDSRIKRIAVSDFLTRAFRENIRRFYDGVGGSGKSGLLVIDDCGMQMIERTSVIIHEKEIEVRFEVGLPAAGRKVLGKSAAQIFCKALPQIVEASIFYKNINQKALAKQVELIMDQQVIREELKKRNLVAFVANGAILPRENGISQRPLNTECVPFTHCWWRTSWKIYSVKCHRIRGL